MKKINEWSIFYFKCLRVYDDKNEFFRVHDKIEIRNNIKS